MYTLGNNEKDNLPDLPDEIFCDYCLKLHRIRYGKKILEDGSEIEDKLLAFVTCDDSKSYLVGVDGKDIRPKLKRRKKKTGGF